MKRLEFGDMVFYSITGLVVILLAWLRFIEESVGLWGAWLAWACWSAFLVGRFLDGLKRARSSERRSDKQTFNGRSGR